MQNNRSKICIFSSPNMFNKIGHAQFKNISFNLWYNALLWFQLNKIHKLLCVYTKKIIENNSLILNKNIGYY